MLQLRLTAALEVLNTAVRRKPGRVPEARRVLHAQLVLEGLIVIAVLERLVVPGVRVLGALMLEVLIVLVDPGRLFFRSVLEAETLPLTQ